MATKPNQILCSLAISSYNATMNWLHITCGERNCIERLFRTMKERTGRFFNNLLSDMLDNLESFLSLSMVWYNHLRKHQELGRIPLDVSLSCKTL